MPSRKTTFSVKEAAILGNDSTATIEDVGIPLDATEGAYCDEIAHLRDELADIRKRILEGKPIGKWRLKSIDRAREVLYRALIFRMTPEAYSYEAGEKL